MKKVLSVKAVFQRLIMTNLPHTEIKSFALNYIVISYAVALLHFTLYPEHSLLFLILLIFYVPLAVYTSNSHSTGATASNGSDEDNGVNNTYLKHVIIKYLTSREYEVSEHSISDKDFMLLIYMALVKIFHTNALEKSSRNNSSTNSKL